MMEFGYLNIIRIDFYGFIPSCSIQFRLIRYDKHSRQCFTTFPNISKSVKNTPLRGIFSLFKNVVKHGLSCLITSVLATLRCLIRVGILTQLCTVGYLQLYVALNVN